VAVRIKQSVAEGSRRGGLAARFGDDRRRHIAALRGIVAVGHFPTCHAPQTDRHPGHPATDQLVGDRLLSSTAGHFPFPSVEVIVVRALSLMMNISSRDK